MDSLHTLNANSTQFVQLKPSISHAEHKWFRTSSFSGAHRSVIGIPRIIIKEIIKSIQEDIKEDEKIDDAKEPLKESDPIQPEPAIPAHGSVDIPSGGRSFKDGIHSAQGRQKTMEDSHCAIGSRQQYFHEDIPGDLASRIKALAPQQADTRLMLSLVSMMDMEEEKLLILQLSFSICTSPL